MHATIQTIVEYTFWAVVTLLLAFLVYNWLTTGNRHSNPRLEEGINPRRRRLDVLRQVEQLEEVLPRLKREPDFWNEFIALFPKIDVDIKLHKDRSSEKRPIVVVGETSAGKSSFLNLMLGVPLLPVDYQHATAGIIKIQKSMTLAVVPNDGTPISPSSPITDQDKAATFVLNTLETTVTSKQAGANEDEKTDHSEVVIHWPFDNELLEEEVTLVDIPGYGETKAMKDMLMKYLNKAVGFLYIINAGNAGGLQYDRLKQIIRDQHVYCDKHKVDIMDPGRALFFFNKWDQIVNCYEYIFGRRGRKKTRLQPTPEERVWNTNIQKLKSAWTEFKPEQAMKFSVAQARGWVSQCTGVDVDQKDIARAKILIVVEDSLKNGLDPTKKWLKRVNGCITSTIETHLQYANTTKGKRDQMQESCNEKTVEINETAQRMNSKIKKKIREEASILAKSVWRHINKYNVKEEMNKWKYEQFPCSLVLDSNAYIKKEIGRIVLEKLTGIITRDMKTETQHLSSTLARYITSKTEKLIKLLKESNVSVVQKNLKTYDHMAIDWFASNLIGVDRILAVFDTDEFSFQIVLTLPFRFLESLLKTPSSPHVAILTKASEEVIKRIDEDTIYKALLKRLERLETEVDELVEKEVLRNLDYLNKQVASICKSTEKPEQTIARYTRLKDTFDSYLCECQRFL